MVLSMDQGYERCEANAGLDAGSTPAGSKSLKSLGKSEAFLLSGRTFSCDSYTDP